MTYAEDTTSIQDSQPTELIEFATPAGTYYYTTSNISFVFSGNTYLPEAGLVRGATEVTSADTAQELEVEVRAKSTFAQQNLFGKIPRDITCRVRILEEQSGEDRLLWEGPVTSYKASGRMVRVLVPSAMDDAIDCPVPRARFQTPCNHFLYDDMCRVDSNLFDFATTVVSVVGTVITVTGVAGNPDQWFRAGYMVRNTDSEKRLIIDQVGAVLRVEYPFRILAATNAVTLFAGCDLQVVTCHSKFSNRPNFGGHPHRSDNFVKFGRLIMGPMGS